MKPDLITLALKVRCRECKSMLIGIVVPATPGVFNHELPSRVCPECDCWGRMLNER